MSGETIFTLVMALMIGFAIFKGLRLYYSRPRRFLHGEEYFTWVPDPEYGHSVLFDAMYDGGHFLYHDGTPVTDDRQIDVLRTHWEQINRPRGSGEFHDFDHSD